MWQVYQLFSFSNSNSSSASVSALWFDVAACARDTRTESYLMRVKFLSVSLSLSACVRVFVRWVAGLPPVIKNYSQQIQKRLLFIAMIQYNDARHSPFDCDLVTLLSPCALFTALLLHCN